jgi:hypothetical protein
VSLTSRFTAGLHFTGALFTSGFCALSVSLSTPYH